MKLKVAVISCLTVISVVLTIAATYICVSDGVEHLNVNEYGDIIFAGEYTHTTPQNTKKFADIFTATQNNSHLAP